MKQFISLLICTVFFALMPAGCGTGTKRTKEGRALTLQGFIKRYGGEGGI